VIRRALSLIVIVYLLGFLWFAVALPRPTEPAKTDAIIVPTGGAGRINRGLELLEAGKAKAMLVTGVDREVRPNEFAVQYDVPMELMNCCITLGFAAVDTRSNAAETAQWVRERNYRSLRLVTTDWHMRRAASELHGALPGNVVVVRDAVVSEPSFRNLFLEYNKLIASGIARLWPD
jgi:uncharacterized SAM-binding protein YcdF (DUF218 family)